MNTRISKIIIFLLFVFTAIFAFFSCGSGGDTECRHTVVIIDGIAPTCTSEGKTSGKICSECKEIIEAQESISMIAHIEIPISGKSATCTENGLTDGKKCSVCDTVTVAQSIIEAGHTEIVLEAIPATCTQDGLTEGKKCAVCDEIIINRQALEAFGHTDESLPAKAATCTENGLTEGKKCSVCGVITIPQENIPAAHVEKIIQGKSPTCTDDGLSEGKTCMLCGEIILAQQLISAAHTEEVLPSIPVTCTENGFTEGKKCAVCNEILLKQNEIQALGHNDSDNDLLCDACNSYIDTVADGEYLNIANNAVTVFYNYSNSDEKNAAEAFVSALKDQTGAELSLAPYTKNASDAVKYKIYFGTMRSDVAEFADVYAKIKGYQGAESEVFSISLNGDVLVVTAIGSNALNLAYKKLLSYISEGRLYIKKDHSESYIVYDDNGETIYLNVADYDKTSVVTSVMIADQEISEFSNSVGRYTFYYADDIPDKSQVKLNLINRNANVVVDDYIDILTFKTGINITVTSVDGNQKSEFLIMYSKVDLSEFDTEIINKNGASGVVSFVFDDGDIKTADILNTVLLPKYQGISVTHGLITSNYLDGVGGDPTKKYTYKSTIEGSKYKNAEFTYQYQYWHDILRTSEQELAGRVEFTSHSHTHTAIGIEADYELEIKGSQKILRDLFGIDAVSYIIPGVGAVDPEIRAEYIDMYQNSGTYIGARTNMNMLNGYKVNHVADFKIVENRFSVASLAATYHSTEIVNGYFTTTKDSSKADCMNAGISHWTNYIDTAIDENGWAAYCFHGIISDDINHDEKPVSEYWEYQCQVDALFAYTQKLVDEGKLWCATFTDAQKYYNSWSTAKVILGSTSNGRVTVTVNDNEPDDVYDVALTVKVTVPNDWSNVSFSYAGETGMLDIKTDASGEKFVYVNIVPDTERFIIWNS